MSTWNALASEERIAATRAALEANGFEVHVAANGAEAAKKALSLVPAGAEAFTMASMTLESIGLAKEINESGTYDGVRNKLYAMDPKTKGREMRKYGAAPDYALGSVHAVTESGSLVIASLTGSQLPAYAYGAGTVIWVVGANKIVKDLEAALKRIEEHIVPLESERARAAYGLPEGFRTFPSKVLVYNREVQPGRAKVIIVKEALGF